MHRHCASAVAGAHAVSCRIPALRIHLSMPRWPWPPCPWRSEVLFDDVAVLPLQGRGSPSGTRGVSENPGAWRGASQTRCCCTCLRYRQSLSHTLTHTHTHKRSPTHSGFYQCTTSRCLQLPGFTSPVFLLARPDIKDDCCRSIRRLGTELPLNLSHFPCIRFLSKH